MNAYSNYFTLAYTTFLFFQKFIYTRTADCN